MCVNYEFIAESAISTIKLYSNHNNIPDTAINIIPTWLFILFGSELVIYINQTSINEAKLEFIAKLAISTIILLNHINTPDLAINTIPTWLFILFSDFYQADISQCVQIMNL
jgi:hypothetical protein